MMSIIAKKSSHEKMIASRIKLWQLNLAAAHSEQHWENFGDMSLSRLTHPPFPWLLEKVGEEFKPTKPEASLLSLGAAACGKHVASSSDSSSRIV